MWRLKQEVFRRSDLCESNDDDTSEVRWSWSLMEERQIRKRQVRTQLTK